MPYWYGFRQIKPSPPGRWVGSGPYESYAAAISAYQSAKLEPDAQVSPPFQANNQAEADRIAQGYGDNSN